MISKEEYVLRRAKNYGPTIEDWLDNIERDYKHLNACFVRAVRQGDAGFVLPGGPYTNLRLALNQIENENPDFKLTVIGQWVAIT